MANELEERERLGLWPYDGSNCGNCTMCKEVYKHPWNTGEAKGPMSELFGYVCTYYAESGIDHTGKLLFMSDNEGLCESHEWKQ